MTKAHEETIIIFERGRRTIEIDDLSILDSGMTDTYAVYEDERMLGDFCMTTPFGPVGLPIEEVAWSVVLESDEDA